MAVDIFLKLHGITGEAQDRTHSGAIDILSWSWGMSQSGTTHMGSGGGAGKVSVQDISLSKYLDSSTHALVKHCTSGQHIASGELIVRKAGGDKPVEYLKITFEELMVSSYQTGGSKDGLDRVMETITLNFRKFDMAYLGQEATGAEGGGANASWDIAANAA